MLFFPCRYYRNDVIKPGMQVVAFLPMHENDMLQQLPMGEIFTAKKLIVTPKHELGLHLQEVHNKPMQIQLAGGSLVNLEPCYPIQYFIPAKLWTACVSQELHLASTTELQARSN